jgi:hypothetical protein
MTRASNMCALNSQDPTAGLPYQPFSLSPSEYLTCYSCMRSCSPQLIDRCSYCWTTSESESPNTKDSASTAERDPGSVEFNDVDRRPFKQTIPSRFCERV